jgi:phosphoribosylformylglycinamidine (FGAM) synthase PurS component
MFHDIKVVLEITIAAEADTEEEAQRHVDSMSNEELLTTILEQHSVPDLHTQTLQ